MEVASWHQQQDKTGQAALYVPPSKGYRVVIDHAGQFASSVEFTNKRMAERCARRTGGIIIPAHKRRAIHPP